MFNALGANFGLTGPEAAAAISGLRLSDRMGRLGSPVGRRHGAIPFGADLGNDHEQLFVASENIRTYTEQTAAHLQTDIQEAIRQSAVIVILGFGFHQQNMAILNFSTPTTKRIYGTVLNIDRENYESLARNLAHIFRSNIILPRNRWTGDVQIPRNYETVDISCNLTRNFAGLVCETPSGGWRKRARREQGGSPHPVTATTNGRQPSKMRPRHSTLPSGCTNAHSR